MIDTHAHLTWHSYEGRVDEVISNARAAGITAIIDLGTDPDSSRRARDHAEKYEGVYFAAGVHPNDAGEIDFSQMKVIEELCNHPKCVAVGEIGLDYYRDFCAPEIQKKWLNLQLELAVKLNKPVVIHDRKASEDILEELDKFGYDGIKYAGGVFHCFAGNRDFAREVLKRGFYISFTGNLTFKKSDRPEVAEIIPIDRLLLETDSPFMAPVPKRGKQNEPAYLPYVAAGIANVKKLSLEEVDLQTTENAKKLFRME